MSRALPPTLRAISGRVLGVLVFVGWSACHAAGPNPALLAEHEKRAEALFGKAQRLAAAADLGDALEKYESIIKHYPRSSWAAKAQWEIARLYDDNHEYANAFDAYQLLVEHFPGHFEKALEAQFRLALKVLAYYDQLLRKPDAQMPKELPEKEQASSMLRIIIKNGPFAPAAAEAQYYYGVALEKEGESTAAREQHELLMEKFPEHPLADDACYQAAYIEYKSWQKMLSAAPQQRDRADVALRDFLLRYSESDKAAQARTLLTAVREGQRKELLDLARFYETQGKDKASGVYYLALAKAFPDSVPEGSALAEKLSSLLAKYPELQQPNPKSAPKEAAPPVEDAFKAAEPEPEPELVPKALPVTE